MNGLLGKISLGFVASLFLIGFNLITRGEEPLPPKVENIQVVPLAALPPNAIALLTRAFRVVPDKFEADLRRALQEKHNAGAPIAISTEDLQNFFKGAGLASPIGSSVIYNRAAGVIIATNTAANLGYLENVLTSLGNAKK